MPMMAITTNNSLSVNPFCILFMIFGWLKVFCDNLATDNW